MSILVYSWVVFLAITFGYLFLACLNESIQLKKPIYRMCGSSKQMLAYSILSLVGFLLCGAFSLLAFGSMVKP